VFFFVFLKIVVHWQPTGFTDDEKSIEENSVWWWAQHGVHIKRIYFGKSYQRLAQEYNIYQSLLICFGQKFG
jgi:hypothetical protein